MKPVTLVRTLLVFLAFSAPAVAQPRKPAPPKPSLQAQIDSLRYDLTTLKSRLDAMPSDLSGLSSKIEVLKGKVDMLQHGRYAVEVGSVPTDGENYTDASKRIWQRCPVPGALVIEPGVAGYPAGMSGSEKGITPHCAKLFATSPIAGSP